MCERQRVAERKFGPDCARRLRSRLADLEAVTCVTELVAGRPHPLHGVWAGLLALDLTGGRRIVLAPDHDPVPLSQDGSTDWAQVTRVSVVFIGDYHE